MPDFGNSGVKKQASWNNHIWLWIFWWRLRNPLFWWRVRNPLFWWKLRNPPWKKIHRGKKSTKFKIHRGKKSTVEKNPPIQNPPWKKIHRPRSADSGSTVASDGRTRKCLVTDVSWEEGVTH
jgi:hypothetical protein